MAFDRHRQGVQGRVRALPDTETVREAQHVRVVDRHQNPHHRTLDDLVLQSRDAQRAQPAAVLGDVRAQDRLGPVAALLDPFVQISEPVRQEHLVLRPAHTIDPRGRLVFQRAEALLQQLYGHVVEHAW